MFIELTRDTDEKIIINVNNIVSVQTLGRDTLINHDSGMKSSIKIKESYQMVIRLIEKASTIYK